MIDPAKVFVHTIGISSLYFAYNFGQAKHLKKKLERESNFPYVSENGLIIRDIGAQNKFSMKDNHLFNAKDIS